MKFALVRLLCNNKRGSVSEYHSHILLSESNESTLGGHRKFATRQEMITVMVGILATQNKKARFSEVLRLVELNGSFDFAGENRLDLTNEQAESLGWPKTDTKK